MPIPFVYECQQALVSVSTAKSEITDALDAIKDLATDDTWSGGPADAFMTDVNGLITDALNALGEPLSEARSECLANAQRMQVESARRTAGG